MIEITHRTNGTVLYTAQSAADVRAAVLEAAKAKADLSGADLRGADLSGADLRWANLRGADLRGADLSGADLREADLRGADLRWADLRWADLREADLSGADLRWANLREADLSGADLSEASSRVVLAVRGLPSGPVEIQADAGRVAHQHRVLAGTHHRRAPRADRQGHRLARGHGRARHRAPADARGGRGPVRRVGRRPR